MANQTQTVHAIIKKARTFNAKGDTVHVFEMKLVEAIEGAAAGDTIRMQVYPFWLAGRFMPPRLALVDEGDVLSFHLEGLSLSDGFLEFERFVEFDVNTYRPTTE